MPRARKWWFRVGCDVTRERAIRRLTIGERYLFVVVMHALARLSPTPGVLLDPVSGRAVTADELADEAGPGYTSVDVSEGIKHMTGLVDEVVVDHGGDDVETAWRIVAWNDTQFESAGSADRVARYRKKKAAANDTTTGAGTGAGEDVPDGMPTAGHRTTVELVAAAARVVGTRDAQRAANTPGKDIGVYDRYLARCIENRYTDPVIARLVVDHPDVDAEAIADLYDAHRNPPALTLVPTPPPSPPPLAAGTDDDGLADALEASLALARIGQLRTRTGGRPS